jgi:hypothetical protein
VYDLIKDAIVNIKATIKFWLRVKSAPTKGNIIICSTTARQYPDIV